MNTLQQIVFAGVECLGPGGGGSREFYKRMIEIMPDKERSLLANLLKTEVPKLTEKFQKMKPYEAWFLTLLSEDRWYPKIRKEEFRQACRVGINDTNVTLPRLERNLHQLLDKCVPGWKLSSIFEGDDLSAPNVEYYVLGELGAARDTFLGLYPNADWPDVDEDALAERRAAEALEHEADLAERARAKRMRETFPEVRGWTHGADLAYEAALKHLATIKDTVRDQDAPKLVKAKSDVAVTQEYLQERRAVAWDRQHVQMKRLEDGLPMYPEGEGPERLEDEDDLG